MHLEFNYEVINQTTEIGKLRIDTPISILLDRSGTIQAIHQAETGNPEKSRIFFERVESLFESVYGH